MRLRRVRFYSCLRFPNQIIRFMAPLLALFLCVAASAAQEVAPLQVLQHHVRPEVANHRAALQGRLAADKVLHLSVVLPLRNQSALTSLLQRLYDPSSPDYRHFLSVAQFTERGLIVGRGGNAPFAC